jgi:hypothetical protein
LFTYGSFHIAQFALILAAMQSINWNPKAMIVTGNLLDLVPYIPPYNTELDIRFLVTTEIWTDQMRGTDFIAVETPYNVEAFPSNTTVQVKRSLCVRAMCARTMSKYQLDALVHVRVSRSRKHFST